jgi:hypothetical protein
MKENKEKDNTLFKRKNLVLEMKEAGITRASSESLVLLEKYALKSFQKLFEILKEEMGIHGKKTLKGEDVESGIRRLNKIESNWEI